MKIKLIHLIACTLITTCIFSCKGDPKNKTEAKSAEEVTEAPVKGNSYLVDTASSIIKWTGSKPTEKHNGKLQLISGSFETENGKLESGSFIMDMTSITVTDDIEADEKSALEGHLKGLAEGKEDHFFDTVKFPKSIFEITGTSVDGTKTIITGNLTIKGISKNISFPVTVKENDKSITLSSEIFTINRTEWGVNYASKSIFTDIGDRFINDDIELQINIKANR